MTYQDALKFLPSSLQKMLYEEQVLHAKNMDYPWPEDSSVFSGEMEDKFHPENRTIFKIPYYLIPKQKTLFCTSKSLNPNILEQLSRTIKGQSYFVFFVHPTSLDYYDFLNDNEDCFFVDEALTEFYASPTSSYRSLLIWTESQAIPFIAKVSVNKIIFAERRINTLHQVKHSVAAQQLFEELNPSLLDSAQLVVFPEVAGFVPDELALKGAPKDIGGQIIRQIPQELITEKVRWIPFQALCSDMREENTPLICDLIEIAGLTAEEFVREYLIHRFLNMMKIMSFDSGIIFSLPHMQNLLFEVQTNLQPTGRFVIRDFTEIRYDVPFLLRSKIDINCLQGVMTNTDAPYFTGGNYFFALLYSYRYLLFDIVLTQLQKHIPEFNQDTALKLRNELKDNFLNLVEKNTGIVPEEEDLETDQPFPALCIRLTDTGKMVSAKASESLELGTPIHMTPSLERYLKSRIKTGHWHDLVELLVNYNKNEEIILKAYFSLYQFYRIDNIIFARDKRQTIIGFTITNGLQNETDAKCSFWQKTKTTSNGGFI